MLHFVYPLTHVYHFVNTCFTKEFDLNVDFSCSMNSQLKSEIQAIRMKSVLRAGDDLSKICARCHTELGLFFNRGDLCPNCRFRVCNMCKENLFQGKWLCVLCYKQRYGNTSVYFFKIVFLRFMLWVIFFSF